MASILKNQKGQTTVEWLMLLAASFTTGYFIITGPFADYTTELIKNIRDFTENIVLTGETSDKALPPSAPKRFKPVHL